MTIEQSIKNVMEEKMKDGTVEKLVGEHLEKGINNALESLFRSYGDVTKTIEEKVKSVMVPFLETYDYSEYVVKLDAVLTDVLKNSASENKKLLNNFKVLMTQDENKDQTIKVTELFSKWTEYVAKNVKTDDLEINYDDGVSYETVEVNFEVVYSDDRSWSIYEHANLVFECEHDEEMNFSVQLHRWKEDKKKEWKLEYKSVTDISSLRHINDFELLLMQLHQNGVRVELDEDCDTDYVQPEAEPEATFN